MEEATITKWHKSVGERVAKKEDLYQVETDKAIVEVESVDAGYLRAILVGEGETATVGQEIATIGDTPEGR
jgi:pyruvate/2-oxoglutarate dehydrogenase complex dihydrolipoamide acyltransferase (E2) component